MVNNLPHSIWAFVLLIWVGLMGIGGLALAEPVIGPSPAEPLPSQGPTSTWHSEADNPAELGATTGFPDKSPGTRPDQARLLRLGQETPPPGVRPPENRPVLSNSPQPGPTPMPPNTPEVQREVVGQEFRDAVKDVIRPLQRDLAESGVAETFRELRTELDIKKDQVFGHSESAQGSANVEQGGAAAAPWEGQANKYGNAEVPRTAAEVERDKILASVMLAKLWDDAKPWLIGLVVVYVLGYLIKLAIAYARYQATRRRRHNQRHRRRRTSP